MPYAIAMQASIQILSDLRRARRYGAACDVEIDAIGDDVYPSVLMDISATGFRAMVDGHIPTGAIVRVRIGDYPEWMAVVIWRRGTIIGCEFSDPLTRVMLLAILRRHAPSSWSDPAVYRGDASACDE